jgi:hypothetical protein
VGLRERISFAEKVGRLGGEAVPTSAARRWIILYASTRCMAGLLSICVQDADCAIPVVAVSVVATTITFARTGGNS